MTAWMASLGHLRGHLPDLACFVAAADLIAECGAKTKPDVVPTRCQCTSRGRKGAPRITMSRLEVVRQAPLL